MGRVLQAPLGVASDLFELVGGNTEASKVADDVKQKPDTVWNTLV